MNIGYVRNRNSEDQYSLLKGRLLNTVFKKTIFLIMKFQNKIMKLL